MTTAFLQRRETLAASGRAAISGGVTALSKVVEKRVAGLQKLTAAKVLTGGGVPGPLEKSVPIEDQLSAKLLSMKKILTAVAMYFEPSWRNELIDKLQRLHDAEEWEDGDRDLPAELSFATFLRTIIYLHPTKRPGIGLSAQGHFLASWRRDTDRIVIEFLPNDELKWVLSQIVDGRRESGAGINQIHRLPDVIAGYEPERFFNDGEKLLT